MVNSTVFMRVRSVKPVLYKDDLFGFDIYSNSWRTSCWYSNSEFLAWYFMILSLLLGSDDVTVYLRTCHRWVLFFTYYFVCVCLGTLFKCVCVTFVFIWSTCLYFEFLSTTEVVGGGGGYNWIGHLSCSLSLHLDTPHIWGAWVNKQVGSHRVEL
jgi:hypothetical protein